MEVGGRGRLYTYRYTVTTRMIPALRWAAMRAILMFQQEVMDKITRQCPQTSTTGVVGTSALLFHSRPEN